LPVPGSLTPSKVAAFKDCALAFRFSVIDRLPEPPSIPALKGTLVHRALQRLFWDESPGTRSLDAAIQRLHTVCQEAREHPEGDELGPSTTEEWDEVIADTEGMIVRYFQLEDPNEVTAVGVELSLEVRVGRLLLRGIIDRLDLDRDGQLVVTDYKTGKAPTQATEQSRLGGVHFYAFLCERALGVRPARVQLLYLREPLAISTVPSDLSIRGLEQRASAVWSAIVRACHNEDFRPRPSALCGYCAFRAYCPAWGGDPSLVEGARGTEGLDPSASVPAPALATPALG
jgi:putative RecB family exonuclease